VYVFFREQLKVLAITASNTWGLTLLVLLLGHGLVDVPRTFWNNAWQRRRLAHTYFSLAKLSMEKVEAEEVLEDVLDVCG
jgi:LMBR1-like membrane protein